MVFRREKQADSFQRQMSALRQRLGDGATTNQQDDYDEQLPEYDETEYVEDYGNTPVANAADSGGYSFGDYATGDVVEDEDYPAEDEQGLLIPEIPVVDSQISVVAADTHWKGNLESEGSLQVYGRVDGSLTAREDIWIADGATVDATVTARRVVVAGTITGNITASERFEALPQGKINADVSAPTFVVHDGAKINGQLKMAQAESTSYASTSSYDRGSSLSVIQRRQRAIN